MRMMAELAVLVARVEGLAVALVVVVVVEDLFWEAKGWMVVEEVGVLMPKARI